jgi:tetratricopeptide (TPR) repeat protein
LFKRVNEATEVGQCLLNIGVNHYFLANYEKALDFYFQALKVGEEQKDDAQILLSLNNIGAVYKKLHNTEKALLHFQRALRMSEASKDEPSTAQALSNLGAVYEDNKQFAEARQNYQRALSIYQETKSLPTQAKLQNQAKVLNNLGDLMRKQASYDQALDYHSQSLKIKEELNDKRGVAFSLVSIGELYLAQKNNEQALVYLKRGLRMASEIGARDSQQDAYKSLASTYASMGNHEQAYNYLAKHLELKDSLALSEMGISDLQAKFQTNQREKELKIKNQETEIIELKRYMQRLWIAIYIAIGLIAIGGGALAWLWRKQKRT